MKAFTKFLLLAAVLSGTVSFQSVRSGSTVTLETTVPDPQKVLTTAGDLLGTADAAFSAAADAIAEAPTAETARTDGTVYRIRNAAGDAASQIGAYSVFETAVSQCPAGYCVFDVQGTLLYTAGG
ncbi:MAG: hypothetical protein IJ055_10715 [Oscillospiraceae bacterium]|nr:hypothetical protein [Oscillospiraceae bacterium]